MNRSLPSTERDPIAEETPLPALPADDALLALQEQLLAWFAEEGRDLPWRHTRNPYHILVAEMMLQQTQVDRVIPKYQAFLKAFPTLADLAIAPTAEVIRQWAGLGYNRRAVNLQRIARTLLDQYDGQFPRDCAVLQQLPGIGPYTAGAIACFAFEQDVGFMDTNIRRVLQRLLIGADDDPSTTERDVHPLAAAIVPNGRGWSWNQGLMELGALICTTSKPACWRCPVQRHCRAYRIWQQADANLFDQPHDQPAGEMTYPTNTQRSKKRVSETAQPFVGSNRYYRGRLVDALRSLAPGDSLPLEHLAQQIKPDFHAATDSDWLQRLIAGLQRDGLVEITDGAVRLPSSP
ncbi:MAG: A/G-specific adenine glycosylase [Chloroflexaceae bacterium]|nr:A/G-specific adenine glycosylase [Chloroflexaceae bacterium]